METSWVPGALSVPGTHEVHNPAPQGLGEWGTRKDRLYYHSATIRVFLQVFEQEMSSVRSIDKGGTIEIY